MPCVEGKAVGDASDNVEGEIADANLNSMHLRGAPTDRFACFHFRAAGRRLRNGGRMRMEGRGGRRGRGKNVLV